jgi:hypothetical protein
VTEAAIQIAIKARLTFHGCLVAHVPNAGKRSLGAGRRLKAEGMLPGFPDLLVYRGGKHALLEVKRPGYSPSDVSPAQREMHATLQRLGFPVAIVTSQDEAVQALKDAGWQIP